MVTDKVAQNGAAEDAIATEPPATPAGEEATQEVMRLLEEHVPLALLADLAVPSGPASPQILEDEGLPEVAWWEGEDAPESDGDGAGEPEDGAGS